ncbi:hypothetical protein V6N13_094673 [Hibiscus sabdariffa]
MELMPTHSHFTSSPFYISSRQIPQTPLSSSSIFTPFVPTNARSMVSAKILPSSIVTSHWTSMNVVSNFQVSVGLTSPAHGQVRFHGVAHYQRHAFVVRLLSLRSWTVGTVKSRVSSLVS